MPSDSTYFTDLQSTFNGTDAISSHDEMIVTRVLVISAKSSGVLAIRRLNGIEHDQFAPDFQNIAVVQETIDPNARIEFRPNTEDDPHKRKPDITRAKELLGWEPKVSLRKGLPLMVSDFRQRIFGDHKERGGASTTKSSD
ncbi:NAD(P)-binding Rossmann-fold superfamily protein [Actinidia rufa]|uniref:NAD(P)-binding Rossmann-fold superfamily protein n=1 Tax=Actinidia rufa TaxID=165716 RepID=A0A7J0GHC2_9ERIC|nr:NAD(P)-binding Rossmann-fold superfamily protein [Actinidia rufa]